MPKIICVQSYRAGAGKSTLTAHLSTILAAQGLRVCLIDADFRNPALHTLFDLEEKKLTGSFADYLLGKCSIEEAMIDLKPQFRQLPLTGGITLLSSYSQNDSGRRIEVDGFEIDRLKDGLDFLLDVKHLDCVLIDTYAGVDAHNLPFVAIADGLVIVMLLDKQDYQGTGVVVDVARRIDVPKVWLVVNSVPSAFDSHQVFEEAENVYKVEIGAVIPHDLLMLEPGGAEIDRADYSTRKIPQALRQFAEAIVAFIEEG